MGKRYSRRARAIEASDRFQAEQISRLRGWSEEKCPKLGPGDLERELDLCLEYHRGRGTLIKDLEAAAREWLLRGELQRRSRIPRGQAPASEARLESSAAARDRETDRVRREVEAEDPEERARAIQAARDRPWRHRKPSG